MTPRVETEYHMVCLSFDTETSITSGFLVLNKSTDTKWILDIIRGDRELAVNPLLILYLYFQYSIQIYNACLSFGLKQLWRIQRQEGLLHGFDGILDQEDLADSTLYTDIHRRLLNAYFHITNGRLEFLESFTKCFPSCLEQLASYMKNAECQFLEAGLAELEDLSHRATECVRVFEREKQVSFQRIDMYLKVVSSGVGFHLTSLT